MSWEIRWTNCYADDDGYTILSICFSDKETGFRRTAEFNTRYMETQGELVQRVNDLADKIKYEINKEVEDARNEK